MAAARGEVWWGPAPHKSSPAYRPWLVVSDDTHPFAATECLGLAMTTQQHSEGIPVPDGAWIRGGSKKDAYVSPWYVATLKHRDIDDQQGELRADIVSEAIERLHGYTPRAVD